MEEKLNFERNLLTKGLLAAGYTVENHPDYVERQLWGWEEYGQLPWRIHL